MVCIRTDAERLDEHVNIRLNPAQFEAINAAARRSDLKVSKWARAVLLDALKREAAKATPKRAA
jgi:hypothetical protein